MSRPDPLFGVPTGQAAQAGHANQDGSNPALRLAIGNDGLGIELAGPTRLACLDITELVVRLPRVRFPFDVSGGVAKFRHKRGELEKTTIELDTRKLAHWAEPRLHGLLAPGPTTVRIDARHLGATITVFERTTAGSAKSTTHLAALAFEIAMTTLGENLVLVVHDARGANLPNVATTLAMHTVAALVGKMAQREGSRFVFEHPTTTLTRHLLPDAGLRAPDTTGITLSAAGNASGVLAFTFARGNAPIDVDAATTLALESAMLVREGDDARFAGDLERARTFDLAALERAPRHSCVSRRIAEIDAFVGNRAEAALAILREADGKPALRGTLDGMLLRETGNVTSAIAELTHAAEQEQASVVSALTFAAAALATQDTLDAIRLLDAAVARAPRIAEIRWERARRRLLARHLADARADFQELEALAQGRFEREQVLRRGADMYRDAGLGAAAADLYERALLYRPDDPSALAGLGLALAREGRAPRGAALLARAIEIAKVRMQPTASMNLELARILGSELGDRPAAIARLAAIADDSPEATCGRGLEGHFRAILGDFAGASLAFARMRERCSGDPSAAPWLLEAATYEANRGELQAAHEHASRALAITPHDEKLLTFYKDLCARIEERARSQPAEPRPAPPAPPTPAREEPFDEGHAEERIEVLSRAVQADPTNDSVVDELAALLSKLGRSMELLALLSARIEDAPAERRQELLPKHRSVLRELERQARDEGRDEEARLFKMAYDASLAI